MGEPGTGVLEVQKVAIESIWEFSEMSITLINDAALDHEKHYWRGGKTIPENARLVHRQCNLQREH